MPDRIVNSYEKKLLRQIIAQDRAVSVLFKEFSNSISPLLAKYKRQRMLNDVWLMNKDIESAINSELRRFQSILSEYLKLETTKAWYLSNDKTDQIVTDFIKDLGISDIAKEGLFTRNLDALKAFQERSVAGLGLSDRVWKVCEQSKGHLELYLQSGLSEGRSASQISRDIGNYLQNPDARFRRVRDENGKLVMSKPMAGYHPGQGVYRSAYKNALRMTRTETNAAYRLSDMERWKKIDFVTGYEVKLSNNHPALDICDYLKGEYPKTFFFDGWHPNCYCYCVPILPSQDDFVSYLNTDKLPGSPIKGIPPSAVNYLRSKSGVFARMINKPSWLKNNFTQRNGIYYPNKVVEKPPKIQGVIYESPVKKPLVSEAFVAIEPKISKNIENALKAINSVHSDGSLPKIPVMLHRMKANAAFLTSGNFGQMSPHSIMLKSSGKTKEFSFIHETGHFLDFSAIGRAGRFETKFDSVITPVIKKIKESQAYGKLLEIKHTTLDHRIRDHINYLCDERELWARSYAQYIAEKSNNRILLTQLENNRTFDFPYHWSEKDFKEIKAEIDKLFTQLGWL